MMENMTAGAEGNLYGYVMIFMGGAPSPVKYIDKLRKYTTGY
jgi:hypothetical protein